MRNEGLENTSCDSQQHVGLWQSGFLKGRKHMGSRVSRAQVLPLGTDPVGQLGRSDSHRSKGSGCSARCGPEGFASTALTRLMILWILCSGGGYCIYFTDEMEKEIAAHSSILAWKVPWTEEPGGLQFMGSQRVGYAWAHTDEWTEAWRSEEAWLKSQSLEVAELSGGVGVKPLHSGTQQNWQILLCHSYWNQ